jgi:O-acetyl-ADP-ribose deacetylase (regulator of RNase III)
MTLFEARDLNFVLRDPRTEILEAWRAQFAERHAGVAVVEGDPLAADTDALVCPGNGFGFMDSGLQLRICETLGWEVQDRVREAIAADHDEELFVGQAVMVATGKTPTQLIYAPIMRTSFSSESVSVYLATRATFLTLARHNAAHPSAPIESVTVPGLGDEAGALHPAVAARQIRYAYEEAIGVRKADRRNLSQLLRREKKLRTVPRSAEE